MKCNSGNRKNLSTSRQKEQPSDFRKKLGDSEAKNRALDKDCIKLKEELSFMEDRATIEKFLKNEAYAFLISEGLLDKFLAFPEAEQRTKTQDAIYTLVSATDLIGFWIELKE